MLEQRARLSAKLLVDSFVGLRNTMVGRPENALLGPTMLIEVANQLVQQAPEFGLN